MEESPSETSSPPQSPVVRLLEDFLERAKAGKLQGVAIAFVTEGGGASVESTPMSLTALNHLARIFDRKVDRAYDRITQAQEQPRAPVPPGRGTTKKAQEVAAMLPRKVRRQVAKAQRKMHQKAVQQAQKPPAVKDAVQSALRRPGNGSV